MYANLNEENSGRNIFTMNLHIIKKHYQRCQDGLESFTMEINEFGDMYPLDERNETHSLLLW